MLVQLLFFFLKSSQHASLIGSSEFDTKCAPWNWSENTPALKKKKKFKVLQKWLYFHWHHRYSLLLATLPYVFFTISSSFRAKFLTLSEGIFVLWRDFDISYYSYNIFKPFIDQVVVKLEYFPLQLPVADEPMTPR